MPFKTLRVLERTLTSTDPHFPQTRGYQMRPHLHILLPSSTSRVALEVRLYLPPEAGPCPAPLSNSPNSQPYTVGPADTQLEQWLRSCEIERLVTACHPWGKLGGSCLDP